MDGVVAVKWSWTRRYREPGPKHNGGIPRDGRVLEAKVKEDVCRYTRSEKKGGSEVKSRGQLAFEVTEACRK